MLLNCPVSLGEIVDKLSILKVKQKNITDAEKLTHVNKEAEHLKAIISLNNGNKAWTTSDYLKSFSIHNEHYKIVYEAHLKNINNISVGNVVNCFFGKTKGAGFKRGVSKIIDLKFSLYLLEKISFLVAKHGKRKIQAYCVREMINIGFVAAKRNIKTMDFLFKKYDKMAIEDNGVLTSINEFKPTMELYLKLTPKSK